MRDLPMTLAALVLGGWLCGFAADRFCGQTSYSRRTVIALCTTLLAIWARAVLPAGFHFASYFLAGALGVLTVTDLRHMRLPDLVTLPLFLAGLALAVWIPGLSLWDRALGALLGYGSFAGLAYLYRRYSGRDGLGLGDAKLMAAAGSWLGGTALPSVVLIASLLALTWVLLRALQRADTWRQPLPFGPALAAAFWLVWLYGPISF